MVFVEAAIVRKIALIVRDETKTKRKKMKKCDASYLRPPRKYMMILKATAIMNLTGMSETIPARASVKG